MEVFQHPFLEAPLKNLSELYYNQVVPRLTTKNKVIAITTAIFLVVSYKISNKIMPPRSLRHIPHQAYFSYFISLISREPVLKRQQRFGLPVINSKENNGLYLRPERNGWEIQVTNPEAVKRVFLKQDLFPKFNGEMLTKSSLGYRFAARPNIALLNGEHWKSQRKIANPAFHRSMPVHLFGKLAQDLFDEMDKMESRVEVTDLMARWTLDAIGKAGFDFDFNAISKRENEWVLRYNSIMAGIVDPLYFMFPILESRFLWLLPKRRKLHGELDRFLDMMRKVIEDKRQKIENGLNQNDTWAENEKDLLTLMLESESKGEGKMTNDELESNLCLFFIAGHDTTANTISFAIYYLAKYPEIQQRAREEARSILGDSPKNIIPTVEDTKKMDYINQIIKETLRINGPSSNVVTRVASEDCELAGTFIPKGAHLTVNVFDTHHSEKNWSDPLEFDPDRFAPDGEGSRGSGQGMHWVPFGNGARQCIGMNFSLNEQRIMLGMLLRKYTWTLPEDSVHMTDVITTGIMVIGPTPMDIIFTRNF